MSDRNVFTWSIVTAVLVLAGAFVVPQLSLFESAKSLIFLTIAVLAYYGEDCYSYMLGIVYPPLWFVVDIAVGAFGHDFKILADFFSGQTITFVETPLHAIGRLTAILVFVAALRAWRREVPERFWGRTFWVCAVISIAYVGVLTLWYLRLFSQRGQMP